MERYPSPHLGMDTAKFWQGMEQCLARLLGSTEPTVGVALQPELIPTIELDPLPESWPDPAQFLEEEEE
jgi:hypothetical protein